MFLDFLWSDDIFFCDGSTIFWILCNEFVEVDEVFFGEVEDGIVMT